MSVKTGRPVKWIEDRSEHMMAAGQSCGMEFDIEAAVKRDGTVLGLKIQEVDDVGGSISTLTIHFTNKLNNLFSTYKVKNFRLEGRSVVTNKCPVVPNRGIGKPSMCFIWERMMDRVAQELGMSPVEVRSKNLVPTSEFPYTAPNGNVYDSGDYTRLLERAVEKLEYEKLREELKQKERRGNTWGLDWSLGWNGWEKRGQGYGHLSQCQGAARGRWSRGCYHQAGKKRKCDRISGGTQLWSIP